MQLNDCAFEPGAAALVLGNYAEAEFTLTSGKGLALQMKLHKRIKIFSKNGLDQANVSLQYYAGESGHFEKVERVKAKCHYLENGSVKTVDLSSKEIFTTKLGMGYEEIKFAIPAVREGCVIEYSYEFLSHDLANIDSWYFQELIPVAHSEMRLVMPAIFVFQKVLYGKYALNVDKSDQMRCSFDGYLSGGAGATERLSYDGTCNLWQWAMLDVPSVRKEPFMGPVNDLAAHMEFQLQRVEYSSGQKEEVMSSYQQFNDKLLLDNDFGKIAKPGRFEKSLVEKVTAGMTEPLAKAAAILQHLQQKVSWNEFYALYAGKSPEKVYESGSGTVAEINLMLVACLRAAGLNADPVVLGTRDYGRPHPIYPNRKKLKNVVAIFELDGQSVFADASSKGLPLGFLSQRCLHGDGWRVSAEKPGFIALQSNATGAQVCFFDLSHDAGAWTGKFTYKSTGYLAAANLQGIGKDGKQNYLKSELEVLSDWQRTGEPSLTFLDAPLGVMIEMPLRQESEEADIMYFKPVFKNSFTENPFQTETRLWPLDLPYALNFNNVLNLTIPEGYTIAEMPENAAIVLGDKKDMVYQYRCSLDENRLMIISKLQMNRIFYLPQEYPDLRKMFDLIEQKHQEMVVLKKG